MEIDINRILSFISVMFLFWPLFVSYKGQTKIKNSLLSFFIFRIAVEFFGIYSKIFGLGYHLQYHLYSFFEFQILLFIYYQMTSTKLYKPLAIVYSLVWVSLKFMDNDGFLLSFTKPVVLPVWITTIVMLILYGSYLLKFNFKNGVKYTYTVFSLAVVSYFFIIITFILYNKSIIDAGMSKALKLQLIRERYIWHVSFMILSTVLYVVGIKFLPKHVKTDDNLRLE